MPRRTAKRWRHWGQAGQRRSTGKTGAIAAWWQRWIAGGSEPRQRRYPSFVLQLTRKRVRVAQDALQRGRRGRSANEVLIWVAVGVVALAFLALLTRQAPLVGLGALAVVAAFAWWEFGRKRT